MLKLRYKKTTYFFPSLPIEPKEYISLSIKVYDPNINRMYKFKVLSLDTIGNRANMFKYELYHDDEFYGEYNVYAHELIGYFHNVMTNRGENKPKLVSIQKR